MKNIAITISKIFGTFAYVSDDNCLSDVLHNKQEIPEGEQHIIDEDGICGAEGYVGSEDIWAVVSMKKILMQLERDGNAKVAQKSKELLSAIFDTEGDTELPEVMLTVTGKVVKGDGCWWFVDNRGTKRRPATEQEVRNGYNRGWFFHSFQNQHRFSKADIWSHFATDYEGNKYFHSQSDVIMLPVGVDINTLINVNNSDKVDEQYLVYIEQVGNRIPYHDLGTLHENAQKDGFFTWFDSEKTNLLEFPF